MAPFVRGGAEYLAESLKTRLEGRGNSVDIVAIPFKWYPSESLIDSMVVCRLLRLEAAEPDLVVALKFPAYLTPWPEKKIWLLHQFRQAYELWGTEFQDIPSTEEGETARRLVIAADNAALRGCRELFTNSKIVASRLRQYNSIEADDVLYPPLADASLFYRGSLDEYFFYPSRLVRSKRQHIAVEAMKYVPGNARLLLAGAPDTAAYEHELRSRISALGLGNRVFLLGRVSEQEKASLMANARGVLYLPVDEDSYGYVTLEAFHSHKAVITFSDSGGTNELVDDSNGIVCEPSPEHLATAMRKLLNDRGEALTLGEAAFESLRRHRISWDYVLDRILA